MGVANIVILFFLVQFYVLIPVDTNPHGDRHYLSSVPDESMSDALSSDTLINYCKLVQSAYFYGQKFADKKLGLSEEAISYYNTQWKDVFNIQFYQTGITATEFVSGARFGEGSHGTFPTSSLYHRENPDPYFLYHMCKEIGMIHSAYFGRCESCVELSTAKINAYLNVLYIREQMPSLWPDPNAYHKLNNIQEIDNFWIHLSCLFADEQIDPKLAQMNAGITHSCDTLVVQSLMDMRTGFPQPLKRCGPEAIVDTLGPEFVSGRPGKKGALYRTMMIVHDPCIEADTCSLYFFLKRK